MLDLTHSGDLRSLAGRQPSILITVSEAKGSAPRIKGTQMVVTANQAIGTIGGGQLEFMAIEAAREMLAAGQSQRAMSVPLGPAIGQCCGGHVGIELAQMTPSMLTALIAQLDAERQAQPHLMIFGAGHVGRALARAALPLPFETKLIDTREDEIALADPDVESHLTAIPETFVATAKPGSAIVIMTHDHALDFLIAQVALARQDLSYVGMIGSKTKRATFASWLENETGTRERLSALTMPIGASKLRDKRPAIIAAMVAAEITERAGRWQMSASPAHAGQPSR
ncbi:MAG: xanthine dehydrogenase accessory protein XdhC [Pseudomonadota bacterium]